MSVQQIIDLQNENAALRRELAERKRCCRCGGPEMRVPESYHAVEAFMSADEVVVLDDVDSDDETHSCDAMGCGSLGNHVVERLIRHTRPASRVETAAKLALDVLAEQSREFSHERRNEAMRALRTALAPEWDNA